MATADNYLISANLFSASFVKSEEVPGIVEEVVVSARTSMLSASEREALVRAAREGQLDLSGFQTLSGPVYADFSGLLDIGAEGELENVMGAVRKCSYAFSLQCSIDPFAEETGEIALEAAVYFRSSAEVTLDCVADDDPEVEASFIVDVRFEESDIGPLIAEDGGLTADHDRASTIEVYVNNDGERGELINSHNVTVNDHVEASPDSAICYVNVDGTIEHDGHDYSFHSYESMAYGNFFKKDLEEANVEGHWRYAKRFSGSLVTGSDLSDAIVPIEDWVSHIEEVALTAESDPKFQAWKDSHPYEFKHPNVGYNAIVLGQNELSNVAINISPGYHTVLGSNNDCRGHHPGTGGIDIHYSPRASFIAGSNNVVSATMQYGTAGSGYTMIVLIGDNNVVSGYNGNSQDPDYGFYVGSYKKFSISKDLVNFFGYGLLDLSGNVHAARLSANAVALDGAAIPNDFTLQLKSGKCMKLSAADSSLSIAPNAIYQDDGSSVKRYSFGDDGDHIVRWSEVSSNYVSREALRSAVSGYVASLSTDYRVESRGATTLNQLIDDFTKVQYALSALLTL